MNSNITPKSLKVPVNLVKGNLLGSGGFAKVYEYFNNETKTSYAGKIVQKSSLLKHRIRQKLISEIKIHKALSHPHIVSLHSYHEDRESIYLFLELCSNNSLSELLKRRKRLTEKETQFYIYQLLLALDYLHGLKVIHRDIKLGNLLLTDSMELKLADFGLAAKLEYEGERKRTVCGTPNYIAPEVLEGNHSYEADIWSLGVLIYTLLIGYPPFQTNNVKTTYKRIKSSIYVFPDYVHLSDTAKDLIGKILISDPMKRINLHEIFLHDFFNRNAVPIHVPASTLAVPPSSEILEKPIDLDEISTSSSEELKPIDRVFVEKWEKIGKNLVYYMNNTVVGINFEDSSMMIGNFEEFFYIEKKKTKYNYTSYCESIKLKVALLKYAIQHFRAFYKEPLDKSVYVKKWVSKEHANVFQLGHKTLQVAFVDKSQIILMKDLQELVYINKTDIKSQHSLSTLNEITNRELVTRIRFVNSIMKAL